LRRAFFLEYDHYKERRNELNEYIQLIKKKKTATTTSPDEEDSSHSIQQQQIFHHQQPWLPHPELRETIPSISLYTCLYQLPSRIETSNELPLSTNDLERKFIAAIDFFDQCIPTLPGFTSSNAAITMLPEPTIVAEAWKKWYYCNKKLRQLRFIRQRIQTLLADQKQREEEGSV
jgi:hypothetical protein